MTSAQIPYTRGLHQLVDRCHAWLSPDGSWGFSNAGLVTGQGQSLLIDTLFDLKMTREMLTAMESVVSEHPIGTVVNTHANGDHWFGNELVAGAEIVASRATAEEMAANDPEFVRRILDLPGPTGAFARDVMGSFDFDGITPTLPTRTFEDSLDLDVAGTAVQIVNLGPAHTAGDSVVFVPSERVLYTGDLVFIGGTPISWTGPISNWITACDRMIALDAAVVVPGHGPVIGPQRINEVRDYWQFIQHEAQTRYDKGMSARDATHDINGSLGRFGSLGDRERLAQNVLAAYYDLNPSLERIGGEEVFRRMAELRGYTD